MQILQFDLHIHSALYHNGNKETKTRQTFVDGGQRFPPLFFLNKMGTQYTVHTTIHKTKLRKRGKQLAHSGAASSPSEGNSQRRAGNLQKGAGKSNISRWGFLQNGTLL